MQENLYEDLFRLEEKHWWHLSKREICLDLIKKYLSEKKPKILDIGCGTGKNLEVFNQFGESWGIDCSPLALSFCRKRGLNRVQKGQAEKTSLAASSFSLITLLDVLEHTSEEKTLAEMRRLLKPQGLLILTTPAFPFLWSRWDEVLHHKKRYTAKALSAILKNQQFRILKISYMYSFLLFPAIIIRIIKSILYKNDYPSDFRLSSPLFDYLLFRFARVEATFLLKHSLPFGTSLIVVAKKE